MVKKAASSWDDILGGLSWDSPAPEDRIARVLRDDLAERSTRYRLALELTGRQCTMAMLDPTVNVQGQRYLQRIIGVLTEAIPSWDYPEDLVNRRLAQSKVPLTPCPGCGAALHLKLVQDFGGNALWAAFDYRGSPHRCPERETHENSTV